MIEEVEELGNPIIDEMLNSYLSLSSCFKDDVFKIMSLPPDKKTKIDGHFIKALEALSKIVPEMENLKKKEKEEEQQWQLFKNGTYDAKLIEFIRPYSRVSIETIVEHFFPPPSPFVHINYDSFRGHMYASYPGQPAQQRYDNALKTGVKKVTMTLQKLIDAGKIQGYLRPFGGTLCYIVLEPAVPPIVPIHIGNVDTSTHISTGDITTTISTGDISSVNTKSGNCCPKCGFEIENDWVTCPQCNHSLQQPIDYCTNCGKKIQADWKVCPYCSTKISE